MTADFDFIIIGAGVIGLATAATLASSNRSVLVLERNSIIGAETSSRNSEVVHAGIYYPIGSLKAQLCVVGKKLLWDFCSTYKIPFKKTGKIIVATSVEEETKLAAIAALAAANGVDDLQSLAPFDVLNLEPEIRCTRALLSPGTSIVDSHAFMLALRAQAEDHKAIFAFNTSFAGASRDGRLFVISTTGQFSENAQVSCKNIINCAGHGAHDVALSIEGIQKSTLPPRFFAQGNYCSVSGKAPFQHLVYPTPVSGALGVHATIDLAGSVRFGPDIRWVDGVKYEMPDGLPETFTDSIARYWPGVRDRVLYPSYCGVRPKIHGQDRPFADFKIQGSEEHGVPGVVNLFGIESPGLTASLAIARYVTKLFCPTEDCLI